MFDTNEERLLTDLLRELAEADGALTAPADLDARAIASWERSRTLTGTTRSSGRKAIFAIAAAIPLLIAGSILFRPGVATTPSQQVDVLVPSPPQATVEPIEPAAVASPARTIRRGPAQIRRQTIDFVPLVPMTPGELSGSFQIVRVQMPRAALGALARTMDMRRAQDPVLADVLLGEDGMARAIRVSTDGTAPWRLR